MDDFAKAVINNTSFTSVSFDCWKKAVNNNQLSRGDITLRAFNDHSLGSIPPSKPVYQSISTTTVRGGHADSFHADTISIASLPANYLTTGNCVNAQYVTQYTIPYEDILADILTKVNKVESLLLAKHDVKVEQF